MNAQGLKATPLLDLHRKEGGKLVSFAGWQMPIEYRGILEEHKTVRRDKGMFDLSHMGEIEISGTDSFPFIQNLITNDLSILPEGGAIYTVMCKEEGGILDDLLVYNLGEKILLVVNASNTEKILNWLCERKSGNILIENKTDEIALLAVQGPQAETFLQPLASIPLAKLPYYHSEYGQVARVPCLISRTGYTGEDGFELYVKAEEAEKLWAIVRERGAAPIGLGARDTLRLEAAYLLYGNDMDESTSPLEVGLAWVVKFNKENFIGKEFLMKQKEKGVARKLIGLSMSDRSVPRKGYALFQNEKKIGSVTSGTFSPSLQKGIGLALVENNPGAELQIEIRNERHPAVICKKPFVKGSVKSGS